MVTCTPMARALTNVRTGRLRRFSTTIRWIKSYDTVTTVGHRSALRIWLLVFVGAACSHAQSTSEFLARLDRFAKTFNGAKAGIRSVSHIVGVPDDEVDSGVIYIKRSGGKAQFRIDFTGPNSQSVEVREQLGRSIIPSSTRSGVRPARLQRRRAETVPAGIRHARPRVGGELRDPQPEARHGGSQGATYMETHSEISRRAAATQDRRDLDLRRYPVPAPTDLSPSRRQHAHRRFLRAGSQSENPGRHLRASKGAKRVRMELGLEIGTGDADKCRSWSLYCVLICVGQS